MMTRSETQDLGVVDTSGFLCYPPGRRRSPKLFEKVLDIRTVLSYNEGGAQNGVGVVGQVADSTVEDAGTLGPHGTPGRTSWTPPYIYQFALSGHL